MTYNNYSCRFVKIKPIENTRQDFFCISFRKKLDTVWNPFLELHFNNNVSTKFQQRDRFSRTNSS